MAEQDVGTTISGMELLSATQGPVDPSLGLSVAHERRRYFGGAERLVP